MNIIGPIVGVNIAAVVVVGAILARRNNRVSSYYVPPQYQGPTQHPHSLPRNNDKQPLQSLPQSLPQYVIPQEKNRHMTFLDQARATTQLHDQTNPNPGTILHSTGPPIATSTISADTGTHPYTIPKVLDSGYYLPIGNDVFESRKLVVNGTSMYTGQMQNIADLNKEYTDTIEQDADIPKDIPHKEQEAVLCMVLHECMVRALNDPRLANEVKNTVSKDYLATKGVETLQGQMEIAWECMLYNQNAEEGYKALQVILTAIYVDQFGKLVYDKNSDVLGTYGGYFIPGTVPSSYTEYKDSILAIRIAALTIISNLLAELRKKDPHFDTSSLLRNRNIEVLNARP